MQQSLWDPTDFFASLTPEFAFLLCLPFFVAGIAFLPGIWRRWRSRREGDVGAKVASPAPPPAAAKRLASARPPKG